MNRANRYWLELQSHKKAVAAILNLHTRVVVSPEYAGSYALCDYCDAAYPCATVEAIERCLSGK